MVSERQPQGPRGRRPHRDLPVVGQPLRGRLQPLLPRQGPPRRRRPDLHPGPRLPRHLRPRLPRGPARPRSSCCASARRSSTASGKGLSSYPHPRLMPDFWEFPTVSMGLTAHQLDLPGAVQPLPAATAASRTPASSTCGRSSATARWASPSRWARSASPPARSSTTSPGSSTATCSSSTARSRGNGKIIQELEANFRGAGWNVIKVDLGPRVGRAARPRRRRRAGQPDEQHARRRSSRPTRSRTAPTSASTSSAATRGCARWSST